MIAELELQTEAPSERAALPVCLPPWRENPYRLVSLWDMLRFHAGSFVIRAASLMKFWQGLRHGAAITPSGAIELARP